MFINSEEEIKRLLYETLKTYIFWKEQNTIEEDMYLYGLEECLNSYGSLKIGKKLRETYLILSHSINKIYQERLDINCIEEIEKIINKIFNRGVWFN